MHMLLQAMPQLYKFSYDFAWNCGTLAVSCVLHAFCKRYLIHHSLDSKLGTGICRAPCLPTYPMSLSVLIKGCRQCHGNKGNVLSVLVIAGMADGRPLEP